MGVTSHHFHRFCLHSREGDYIDYVNQGAVILGTILEFCLPCPIMRDVEILRYGNMEICGLALSRVVGGGAEAGKVLTSIPKRETRIPSVTQIEAKLYEPCKSSRN